LLIDDGSHGEETLRSIETLEALACRQSLPLRIIRQENKGLAAARNVGLAEAGCEFISFLDGDDIIEADFYETALPLLKEHPRLGGVAAWASIFGSYDGLWNAPQPELPLLFVENTVIVPCLMRTELLRQLGGYDVRQRYNYEDWELSIRMLLAGWPIVTIPACLLRYRIRESSMYRTMTDVQDQVMQETLFERHREAVSDFAVGIAMQLEHRYMKLACTSNNDDEIKRQSEIIFALQKRPLRFLKKCFHHLLSKRRRI
jgi:hypothetical protein